MRGCRRHFRLSSVSPARVLARVHVHASPSSSRRSIGEKRRGGSGDALFPRERETAPRPFPQRRRWKDERIGNWWTVRDRSNLSARRWRFDGIPDGWRGGPLNALESNGEESRDSGTCQKIRAPFSGWRQKPNAHLFEPRCRVYAYIHVGQT